MESIWPRGGEIMETSVSQTSDIVKSAYLSFFSDGYDHEHNDNCTIPRPSRRESRCRVHIDRHHILHGTQGLFVLTGVDASSLCAFLLHPL